MKRKVVIANQAQHQLEKLFEYLIERWSLKTKNLLLQS